MFSRAENDNEPIGSAIDPAEFVCDIVKSRTIYLTDIVCDAGSGIITAVANRPAGTASTQRTYIDCSVCVDLKTGKLSNLPSDARAKYNARQAAEEKNSSMLGKYQVAIDEEQEETLTIKTSSSSVVDVLKRSDFGGIMELSWNPKRDILLISVSGAYKGKPSLLVYNPENKERRIVSKDPVGQARWSPDGRLVVCIKPLSREEGKELGYNGTGRGSVIVFDANNGYKQTAAQAKLVSGIVFSKSGERLAFTKLVKDKYGDYASHSLVVLDIDSGKTRTILTNYREPKFIWSGDEYLLVSTCDKYAAPSLSLVTVSNGKIEHLSSDREAAVLQPLAYLQKYNTAVYRTFENANMDGICDLWLAKQGGEPVKLIPDNVEDARHAQR